MADPQPDASGDLPAKKTRTPDAHAMRGEGYGIRYSAMHAMQQDGNSSGRQGGRKKTNRARQHARLRPDKAHPAPTAPGRDRPAAAALRRRQGPEGIRDRLLQTGRVASGARPCRQCVGPASWSRRRSRCLRHNRKWHFRERQAWNAPLWRVGRGLAPGTRPGRKARLAKAPGRRDKKGLTPGQTGGRNSICSRGKGLPLPSRGERPTT